MIKFIVFWTVINTFSVPCDFDPTPDAFGRMPSNWTVPSVACFDTEEVERSREFDTFAEALDFVVEGQGEDSSFMGDGLKNFRIVKSQEVASFEHDPPFAPDVDLSMGTFSVGGNAITFGDTIDDLEDTEIVYEPLNTDALKEFLRALEEYSEMLEKCNRALQEESE